jgi:small subunit ribosomal protein S17
MNAKEQNNMEKELENMGEENAELKSEEELEGKNLEVTEQPEIPDEKDVSAVEDKEETEQEAEEERSILQKDERKNLFRTKRILQGKVISNKPNKTIVIKVERQVAHPIYKKYYKKAKKFMAHDENNECNINDIVRVRECRPLSARKCWELVEIVERAK